MVFRKLQNLVSRQAQATASKETANIQPYQTTSNPNQLYFVALVLQQQRMKFLSLLSLTKAVRKKEIFLKINEMKVLSLLLMTKTVRGKDKIQKFKIIQISLT